MAAVAKLSVNGCAEIENLLTFCEIPAERICVEEAKEFTSNKVPYEIVGYLRREKIALFIVRTFSFQYNYKLTFCM